MTEESLTRQKLRAQRSGLKDSGGSPEFDIDDMSLWRINIRKGFKRIRFSGPRTPNLVASVLHGGVRGDFYKLMAQVNPRHHHLASGTSWEVVAPHFFRGCNNRSPNRRYLVFKCSNGQQLVLKALGGKQFPTSLYYRLREIVEKSNERLPQDEVDCEVVADPPSEELGGQGNGPEADSVLQEVEESEEVASQEEE